MIKFIRNLSKKDLNGKKVLLRVDFDVPVMKGKVVQNFRIESHKETINHLLSNGAKVLLVSHISAIESFYSVVEHIGEVLGHTLTLIPHSELDKLDTLFLVSPLLLLDNVRQDKREMENDDSFARELSRSFDFYVNDAFAVCHRKHASVVAITKHLVSYAGFLIKNETENLSHAIEAPEKGKILVLGGAKISTKLPIIKNFIGKADKILIGGAIANNFFKASGINIGSSVVTDTVVDISDPKIILPDDILVTEDKTGKLGATNMPLGDIGANQIIVDIGPESAKKFAVIIEKSDLVIWNGPMGLSEIEVFISGTKIIAGAVARAERSIIGGGDTITAVDKLGLLDKISFVSTGGGAMLAFLAGEKLPGLEALGYYQQK